MIEYAAPRGHRAPEASKQKPKQRRKQMCDIPKSETVLANIPVDWRDYEPPGGNGWRKTYCEDIKPMLEESRQKAFAEKACLASSIDSWRNKVQSAKEICDAAEKALSALPDGDVPSAVRFRRILAEGKSLHAKLLSEREEVLKAEKDIQKVEEDIKFFDDFRRYIDADAELDKMIFALYTVPVHYRAKIIRACGKGLAVVEEARDAIRVSKSEVLALLMPLLEPIFNSLDAAYACTGPSIRGQIKDFKKRGMDALMDLDDVGNFFRANPKAVKKIAASVQSAITKQ